MGTYIFWIEFIKQLKESVYRRFFFCAVAAVDIAAESSMAYYDSMYDELNRRYDDTSKAMQRAAIGDYSVIQQLIPGVDINEIKRYFGLM